MENNEKTDPDGVSFPLQPVLEPKGPDRTRKIESIAKGQPYRGLDPGLRCLADLLSLGRFQKEWLFPYKYPICEGAIVACLELLSEIIPYWSWYETDCPSEVAKMTREMRTTLIWLRSESDWELPPVPSDLLGIDDWMTDVRKLRCAYKIMRERTDDSAAQDRVEIAQGTIVETTAPNAADAVRRGEQMATNEKTYPDDPSAPRPAPPPLDEPDDAEPPFELDGWDDIYEPYDPPMPSDPNDLDFLDAALAGITQWRSGFVYGIGTNAVRLRHYTACARYIFPAYYSYYGWLIRKYRELRLFKVPPAENPDRPSKRDVIALMSWFEDAFAQREKASSWAQQERDQMRTRRLKVSGATVETTTPKATANNADMKTPQQRGENPVRIQTAIAKLKVSHSRVKQAARNREIYSERAGAKKNSPYLVLKSQVEDKFRAHGAK